MSQPNKKKPTEDLMESLMAELKLVDDAGDGDGEKTSVPSEGFENSEELNLGAESDFGLLDLNFGESKPSENEPASGLTNEIASNSGLDSGFEIKLVAGEDEPVEFPPAEELPIHEEVNKTLIQENPSLEIKLTPQDNYPSHEPNNNLHELNSEKTVALTIAPSQDDFTEGDRTVAVAGYSNRNNKNIENDIKISVGQSSGNASGSAGYSGWGSTDSHLAQVENLKIAQNKILDLEKENERLRHQNEELISASEIIKERSDLLTAQIYEYKNDREGLEGSYKNELALVKSQLNRKDAELQKAQMKIEELDSRLKFDMKKIRIRERELENRLELVRAEKNALVRSKDEQILEARRKIDQLQLEVDSYRQKCVELNRALETNQDSFKRTTRALRLAMANLELQEENKTPLKKVD